jgi:replicative DNA helicase
MSTPEVKSADRWTHDNPCPICGGFQSGTGDEHCWGFMGENGPYCTNEESEDFSDDAEAWLHSNGVTANGSGPKDNIVKLPTLPREALTIADLAVEKGISRETFERVGCRDMVRGVRMGKKIRTGGDPKYVWIKGFGPSKYPLFPMPGRRMHDTAYFTTGETDMLTLREVGFNAYAITSGEKRGKPSLTVQIWTALRKRGLRHAIIAGDADEHGQDALPQQVAAAQSAQLRVSVIDLAPYFDPLGDGIKDLNEFWLHLGCDQAAFIEEVDALTVERRAPRISAVSGGRFALDAAQQIDAVWGKAKNVLWAAGEACMISGSDGTGKTTIAQQLALCRIEVFEPVFLGFPITPGSGKVLYLALDRPSQAERSIRRMVEEEDRDILNERLVVWEGHLPFDLMAEPEALLAMAQEHDADTVIVDQVKDAILKMSDEDVGAAYNFAVQECVQNRVEVLSLHIPRKGKVGENKKPASLDDIYGSRLLKQGHGSVISLWAQSAGDPIVDMAHLKQPGDAVGPLRLLHDNVHGETSVYSEITVVKVARKSGKEITAKSWAQAKFKKEVPTPNEIERARRELVAQEAEGKLECLRVGQRGRGPTVWIAKEASDD